MVFPCLEGYAAKKAHKPRDYASGDTLPVPSNRQIPYLCRATDAMCLVIILAASDRCRSSCARSSEKRWTEWQEKSSTADKGARPKNKILRKAITFEQIAAPPPVLSASSETVTGHI